MNDVAKLLNIKNKKVFTTNEKDGLFYLNKQGIFRHDPKSDARHTHILNDLLSGEDYIINVTKSDKLIPEEQNISSFVSKDYAWIARDKSNKLYIYKDKPIKLLNLEYWDSRIGIPREFKQYNHLFQFIKWTDKEPFNVNDIVDGYAYKRRTPLCKN